ncbi:fibronectin type III domain-containing protein [Rhodococcus sp. SJ-2]
MTTPNQSTPDGSLGTGDFASWQAMTEADAKNKMKIPLGAWNSAQDGMQNGFAGTPFVQHEVDRLDNRIDEFAGETGTTYIATMSTSGWWTKPPGASRVTVHKMAGSSGGGRSNRPGDGSYPRGIGGFSGGWVVEEYNAEDLPSSVWVTIGPGGAGGTSVNTSGAPGGDTTFGTYGQVAPGASSNAYGTGNKTFRMRGGDGAQITSGALATNGSAGSYTRGGYGSADYGGQGENGFSLTGAQIAAGQVGMGSAGGGGGPANSSGNTMGGRGGQGGWPSGPGGGGGAGVSALFGSIPSGNGGNAGSGACIIFTYTNDEKLSGPTTPTNLTASNVTETSATITWTAATDDVAVTEYEIFVNGLLHGSTGTITFDLTGLQSGITYAIVVAAVDANGNRADSATLPLTTGGENLPPEVVGSATGGYVSGVQNFYDIPVPAHQPLDLLVAIVGTRNNATMATPSGWTRQLVAFGANSPQRVYVFTKVASASEPAVVGMSASEAQKWQAAIIAVRYAQGVDVTAGVTAATATTRTLPAVTTTVPATLILHAAVTSASSYYAKTWNGATEVTDHGDGSSVEAGVSLSTARRSQATVGTTPPVTVSDSGGTAALATIAFQ